MLHGTSVQLSNQPPQNTTNLHRIQTFAVTWGLNPRDVFTLRINSYSDGRHLPMYANSRLSTASFCTEGFAHISTAIGALHAGTTLSTTKNNKDHQETSAGPCALYSCSVASTWPYALPIGNSCCTHRDKGHQVSLETAWASRWDSRIVALTRRVSVNLSMPRVASFCFSAGQVLKIEVCQHAG